jgi:hypothetical protein
VLSKTIVHPLATVEKCELQIEMLLQLPILELVAKQQDFPQGNIICRLPRRQHMIRGL